MAGWLAWYAKGMINGGTFPSIPDLNPRLDSISSVAIGGTVTLSGANFGAHPYPVRFGTTTEVPSYQTNQEIQVRVPPSLGPGTFPVRVNRGGFLSNELTVTVRAPEILATDPSQGNGAAGQILRIDGSYFGSPGEVRVGDLPATVLSWSDTTIWVRLPSLPAATHELRVTEQYGYSATGTFLVAAQPSLVSVEGGWGHTCAVTSEGTVYCWGSNVYGQLGTGDNLSGPTPRPVVLPSAVARLALSLYATCAVTIEREVWCWGGNPFGELGNGSPAGVNSNLPVRLSLPPVATITAGFRYFCITDVDGAVLCWGSDLFSALGPGPEVASWGLRLVTGLPGPVTAISGGGGTTCAVSQGEVWCWGTNHQGVAGLDPIISSTPNPNRIAGVDGNALAIAGGQYHFCVSTDVPNVQCWGDNRYGQLGDGTQSGYRTSAAPVVGLGDVTDISAHVTNSHTCASLPDGEVACWGNNGNGQLGNSAAPPIARVPVIAQGLSDADSVGTGYLHSCAVHSRGAGLMCWGYNGQYQVGVGAPSYIFEPLEVWLTYFN